MCPSRRAEPTEPGILDIKRDAGVRDLLNDPGTRDLAMDPGLLDVVEDLGRRQLLVLGASLEGLLSESSHLSGGILLPQGKQEAAATYLVPPFENSDTTEPAPPRGSTLASLPAVYWTDRYRRTGGGGSEPPEEPVRPRGRGSSRRPGGHSGTAERSSSSLPPAAGTCKCPQCQPPTSESDLMPGARSARDRTRWQWELLSADSDEQR